MLTVSGGGWMDGRGEEGNRRGGKRNKRTELIVLLTAVWQRQSYYFLQGIYMMEGRGGEKGGGSGGSNSFSRSKLIFFPFETFQGGMLHVLIA
jgi:hypothetical protein